jgi:hypothetical protein
MKCARAVVFVLAFLTPAAAHAAPVLPGAPDTLPLLFLCLNDECHDLSFLIQPLPGGKTVGVIDEELVFPLAQIMLSRLVYDPDPSISFTVSSTNLGPEPVTYGFLFGTTIDPGFYGFATSEAELSVNNGITTTTVDNSSLYPTYVSGYGTVDLEPTNLGADLGTAPCVAGPGLPFSVTTECDPGKTSNSFELTSYNNLEALLTYTQEGSAGNAQWKGTVALEVTDPDPSVPEPTLLGLFGLATMAFGLRRRRK